VARTELNKAIVVKDSFVFSDSNVPIFQPQPIRIQTIGILRNKPAIAYMGPYSKGYTRKKVSKVN